MIVTAKDVDEMVEVARSVVGPLSCTLHVDTGDGKTARSLLPVLERKAGRVLANGFTTGVEVFNNIVQGAPYPVSTNFGATSVGTMLIRRFLRLCALELHKRKLICFRFKDVWGGGGHRSSCG